MDGRKDGDVYSEHPARGRVRINEIFGRASVRAAPSFAVFGYFPVPVLPKIPPPPPPQRINLKKGPFFWTDVAQK